jgi:hypothetical protein
VGKKLRRSGAGPLVYVLKIEEDWKFVEGRDHFGEYYEVYPKSPWNYGLARWGGE